MTKRRIYKTCVFCRQDVEIDEGIFDSEVPFKIRIPYHYNCYHKKVSEWVMSNGFVLTNILNTCLLSDLDYLQEEDYVDINDSKWNKRKIIKFFDE